MSHTIKYEDAHGEPKTKVVYNKRHGTNGDTYFTSKNGKVTYVWVSTFFDHSSKRIQEDVWCTIRPSGAYRRSGYNAHYA